MRVAREDNLYVVAKGSLGIGGRDRVRFVCDGEVSWEEKTGYDGKTVIGNRNPATLTEWSEMIIEEILSGYKTGNRMVNPLRRLVAGTINSAELNKRTNRVDVEKS